MSIPHLNALRAFEASVRHGSFRAAADELGVTAAAVGQQVRKLEVALGQQLLERHANGFEPTAIAVSGANRLAAGFDELRGAVEIMGRNNQPNRVFLTVTPTIGERWLAPRLPKFLAENSAIDLRVDSTPYVIYKPNSEFDFALRYDRPGVSGYREIPLFNECLLPVCTPDVASRMVSTERDDCLLTAPLIHVDRSTDDPDWLHWKEWAELFGYAVPDPYQGLHATFTTLALRSLYDGNGLHLAQLSVTLPDLSSGRLVAPFGKAKCVRPGYPYSLVRMSNGRETPIQAAFRKWIVDEARMTQVDMDAYLT